MKWEVHNQAKSIACDIPANVNADMDFSATLAETKYHLRWHATAKRLTLLHRLDNGLILEEYLYLEQAEVQAFNGGAEVSLLYWQSGELKQLQGRVGLALALHARQHSNAELLQTINSPLTGKVIQVHAVAGKAVKKGELLFVIEAMKMENRIQAPADATVIEVNAALNTTINVGDTLLKLQQL